MFLKLIVGVVASSVIAVTSRSNVPVLVLPKEAMSPTLIFNFSILPSSVEGTSKLDLSLSIVINGTIIFIY